MFIGEIIKSLREDKGYTQKQMAEVLHITPGCLSKYETGKSQIPIDTIIKIADLFNVSVDYIVGRHNSPFDYSRFNKSFINSYKVSDLLNDIDLLSQINRSALVSVIIALKCKEEMEKMEKYKKIEKKATRI